MKKVIIEKLTHSVIESIDFAKREVNNVGTEYLLLGLINNKSDIAKEILISAGINSKDVRNEIAKQKINKEKIIFNDDIFTSKTNIILKKSFEESKYFGHSHIGTGHILLAIIHYKYCNAYKILKKLGIDNYQIDQKLIKYLTNKKYIEISLYDQIYTLKTTGNKRSSTTEALFDRGKLFLKFKLYNDAINDFSHAITLDNTNPFLTITVSNYYFYRGIAYKCLEEYEKSLQDLNYVIKSTSNNPDYYFERGLVKELAGKPIEAIYDFDKAINLDHKFLSQIIHRQICKTSLKNYREFLVNYQKTNKCQLGKNKFENEFRYIGLIKLIIKDYKSAIKDFDELLKHNKKNLIYYKYRGVAKFNCNMKNSADIDFAASISLENDFKKNQIYKKKVLELMEEIHLLIYTIIPKYLNIQFKKLLSSFLNSSYKIFRFILQLLVILLFIVIIALTISL